MNLGRKEPPCDSLKPGLVNRVIGNIANVGGIKNLPKGVGIRGKTPDLKLGPVTPETRRPAKPEKRGHGAHKKDRRGPGAPKKDGRGPEQGYYPDHMVHHVNMHLKKNRKFFSCKVYYI